MQTLWSYTRGKLVEPGTYVTALVVGTLINAHRLKNVETPVEVHCVCRGRTESTAWRVPRRVAVG